jgi:hypothetical protein
MLMLVLGVSAALVLVVALVRLLEPRFAFFPMTGETVTPRELGVGYQPLDAGAMTLRRVEALAARALGPTTRRLSTLDTPGVANRQANLRMLDVTASRRAVHDRGLYQTPIAA